MRCLRWAVITFTVVDAGKRSPPHVVLVVADDLPWALFPHAGNDGAAARPLMPHVDALRGDGLALRRHYAYHICAPSRASLLSGRWPHRAYRA